MKRKLLFLFAFILIVIPIKVNAESSTLRSQCSKYCEGHNISNTSALEQCKSGCYSGNSSLINECELSADKENCYHVGVCRSSSDSIDFCNDVDEDEVETFDEEKQDRLIHSVCRAACQSHLNTGNTSASAAGFNGCMGNETSGCTGLLHDSECTKEACLKEELCNSSQFGNAQFCSTNLSSVNYVDTIESSNVDVDYTISNPSSSTSSSSSSSGSIDEDKNKIKGLKAENCYGFGEVVYYATLIVKIFQITAPIILIIWASVDLFKSVIAGDEKKIIEMRKPIIRRFVAAIFVFFVPWIVDTIVSNFGGSNEWITCWKNNRYVLSGTEINNQNPHFAVMSQEESGIAKACKAQCIGQDDEKQCRSDCKDAYWASSTVCYYAQVSDQSSATASSAVTSCYNNFAKEWIKTYNK